MCVRKDVNIAHLSSLGLLSPAFTTQPHPSFLVYTYILLVINLFLAFPLITIYGVYIRSAHQFANPVSMVSGPNYGAAV